MLRFAFKSYWDKSRMAFVACEETEFSIERIQLNAILLFTLEGGTCPACAFVRDIRHAFKAFKIAIVCHIFECILLTFVTVQNQKFLCIVH